MRVWDASASKWVVRNEVSCLLCFVLLSKVGQSSSHDNAIVHLVSKEESEKLFVELHKLSEAWSGMRFAGDAGAS